MLPNEYKSELFELGQEVPAAFAIQRCSGQTLSLDVLNPHRKLQIGLLAVIVSGSMVALVGGHISITESSLLTKILLTVGPLGLLNAVFAKRRLEIVRDTIRWSAFNGFWHSRWSYRYQDIRHISVKTNVGEAGALSYCVQLYVTRPHVLYETNSLAEATWLSDVLNQWLEKSSSQVLYPEKLN